MTLFFDIKKLENQALGSNTKFLEILEDHYQTKVLKKVSFKRFKSIKGISFLLNPQALFGLKSVDIAYIVQYIRLAAKRSYFDYQHYNQTWLDTSFFPEIDLNLLKHNPLINIKTKYIYFKFEDIYNGSKFR